ncbi:MAG TPA: DUF3618 domain-containing protein [Gemmatimonadales bacterium]|nr:DUF3618 domain-containing protein [Gemmatimonadales bacterium]
MSEYHREEQGAGEEPRPATSWPDMGQRDRDTVEIEREIESTRARMSRDIDEIGERLRPSNLAQEAAERVKGRARRTGNNVADFVRENSLAVAAVGLGATWFFTQRMKGGEVSGDRMERYSYTGPERRRSGATGAVREKMHEAREAIAERAGTVGERGRETAERVQERVGEMAGSVKERASELGGRAREQTYRARTRLERMLEENPLALVACAAVAGLAAGLLIPSTRREDELMGPTRDRLADRAEATLERVKDAASDAAEQVGESVRSEVAERGGEVKDAVRQAAHNVGQQAKEAAGTVAREAKDAATSRPAGPTPPHT